MYLLVNRDRIELIKLRLLHDYCEDPFVLPKGLVEDRLSDFVFRFVSGAVDYFY